MKLIKKNKKSSQKGENSHKSVDHLEKQELRNKRLPTGNHIERRWNPRNRNGIP